MNEIDIVITDDDIEWIKGIMPDIEFDDCRINILKNMQGIDVQACPGSGKTTLLVAKLAIIARKWKEEGRGVCVLSHTNVAREEIQERLGMMDVGKKLLSYPHFIGTFQSFMDIFFAMPLLKSSNIPVNFVDTDFVTERRWNDIFLKRWLETNKKDKYVCDPVELPYKFDVSCSETSKTYKELIKVTTDSRKRGEFTYREMEKYAACALEKIPIMQKIFQQRFPIMFIDEAQDTKNTIWEFVNKLYNQAPQNVFYQAYGDNNQAIFNSYERIESGNSFPRKSCLEMLNSKRFPDSNASLANGVAVDKKKMVGEGKELLGAKILHTIFLFKHGEEEKILQRYAELVLKTFSDEEIKKNEKYGCHVLGMVHKLSDNNDEIAIRLSNYFKEYNPETQKVTPTQLIDYFYIADEKLGESGELYQKVEWISKGILKIIKMSHKKEIKYSNSAFKTLVNNIKNDSFREKFFMLCDMDYSEKNEWNCVLKSIYSVFADYVDVKMMKEEKFVEWKGSIERVHQNKNHQKANIMVYVSGSGRSLVLNFGSIHSSKGRTHLSTLIVETKYHEYNLESILSWLSGKSKKLGQRNKQRLKCQYVAMTRAKGLICLAMLEDSVTNEMRKNLIEFGWNVENV